MKVVFEIVGPEKAQEFLKKNKQNRTVSKIAVTKMASDMKAGLWQCNGAAIRFDINGDFIDGQHRMHAIIASGTTQTFLVVYNVPIEAKDTIDVGIRPRNAGDIANIKGITQGTLVAALSKKILAWEKGHRQMGDGTNNISTNEIISYYSQHDLSEYIDLARRLEKKAKFYVISELAFLVWLFSNIDKDDAYRFLWNLHSGLALSQRSSIYLLRQRLEKEIFSKSNLPSKYKLALTIKAWNYFRENKSMTTLRWLNGEVFPMPV